MILKMVTAMQAIHIWSTTNLLLFYITYSKSSLIPLVINTWPFVNATDAAWKILVSGTGLPMDALVAGCSKCQLMQCDGTVGYGGSPDDKGETTLDAMVMDGDTYDVGSVADLRRVKDAVGVARAVMDYTDHTLIVGESATQFALEMGFKEESLATNNSLQIWKKWKENNCQPNFRKNVTPDPKTSCGPYKPEKSQSFQERQKASSNISSKNHDTIGMVVVDKYGHVVAGTSTNGANHKIHGRVGDSPIMGAGAYAASGIGGAAATGDGDVMMRFLPSFYAVMLLKHGYNVTEAAQTSLQPIINSFPSFSGAVIVADAKGNFGAACNNLQGGFHYSAVNPMTKTVTVYVSACT